MCIDPPILFKAYLGINLLGHEADHSPPPSTKVIELVELYILLLYVFMACTGTTLPFICRYVT